MMKYLTTQQVADILNISSQTVRQLAKTGQLKHLRLEREYRFQLEELQKWIDDRSTGAIVTNIDSIDSIGAAIQSGPESSLEH